MDLWDNLGASHPLLFGVNKTQHIVYFASPSTYINMLYTLWLLHISMNKYWKLSIYGCFTMIYPYIKDGDFNMANCFLIPRGCHGILDCQAWKASWRGRWRRNCWISKARRGAGALERVRAIGKMLWTQQMMGGVGSENQKLHGKREDLLSLTVVACFWELREHWRCAGNVGVEPARNGVLQSSYQWHDMSCTVVSVRGSSQRLSWG